MPGIIKAAQRLATIKPDLKGLRGAVCPVDVDSTSLNPEQVFGTCRWYYAYLEHRSSRTTYAAALKDSVMRFNYAQRYTETQPVEGSTTQEFLNYIKQPNKLVYVTARNKLLASVTEFQLRKNKLPYNHHPEFRNKTVDLSAFVPGCYAKNGVIYTGGGDKGLSLFMYLELIGYYDYTDIVGLDDKIEPLLEYKRVAADTGKNFLGFHYKAVDHTNHDDDLKIADIQYRKHREAGSKGKFISDDEARQILKMRVS
jgi:hypothetical protein